MLQFMHAHAVEDVAGTTILPGDVLVWKDTKGLHQTGKYSGLMCIRDDGAWCIVVDGDDDQRYDVSVTTQDRSLFVCPHVEKLESAW